MSKITKYKSTGLVWCPEIPVDWEVKKLKYVSKIKNGATPLTTNPNFWDGDIFWATPVDISKTDYIVKTERTITEEGFNSCGTNMVPQSSIIITTRAPIGNIAVAGVDLCTNQGCKSIVPNRIHSKFAYYQAVVQKGWMKALGQGTTFTELSNENLSNIYFIIPPLPQQKSIANFLDQKTADIDLIISKKQKLIECLKEERMAIINQAVTKGIDPKAKMKDSGIEWIGKIPKHWEVKRLKYVFTLQRGFDLSSDNFVEGDYPVMGSNGSIGTHNSFTTKSPCVTVGRSGSVGEVNFVSRDFWAHNTTLFVINNYKHDWKYIYFFLLNFDLKKLSFGSAVGSLNRNNVHDEIIAFPPIPEQSQIVSHIELQTLRIETTVRKIEQEIDLIKEYRTSLINEVVTGKKIIE